jgi:hypothetical protein
MSNPKTQSPGWDHQGSSSKMLRSQVENGHYSASRDAIVAFANVLKVIPSDLLKGIS